jgi:hypothetical protein
LILVGGKVIRSENGGPDARDRGDLQQALRRSRGRLRPIALEITRGAEPMRLALSFPKR